MRNKKPDDLDWLAFCYIADELPRDEADAFEARLADDQTAREAVARAVDLTRAVAAAEVDAEDRRPTTLTCRAAGAWRRAGLLGRLGWAAAATAVCLAVVLAYPHYRGIFPTAASPPGAAGEEGIESSGSLGQLAVLWNRTREEMTALSPDDWSADLAEERDASAQWSPYPAEDQGDEELLAASIPPSWMFAAVQAVAGGPAVEEPGTSSPEEN